MARRFSDLRAQMSPAAQARADAKVQAMLAKMPLREWSRVRELSQKMRAAMHAQLLPGLDKSR